MTDLRCLSKKCLGWRRRILLAFISLVVSSAFERRLALRPMKPILHNKNINNKKHCQEIMAVCTDDPRAVERWLNRNLRENYVGFDLESVPDLPWKSYKYTGPATMQLATVDSAIVIVIADSFTGPNRKVLPLLGDLLADESLLKTGVGIHGDMVELHQWQPAYFDSIHGRFDMGGIGGINPGHQQSLKRLSEDVLHVELFKSRKIALSNWARSRLTDQQLNYAARDAWAAAAIVHEILSKGIRSSDEIADWIQEHEIPIDEFMRRSMERKECRLRYKQIKRLEEFQQEAEELFQKMSQLAPPRPMVIEYKKDKDDKQ